MPRHIRLYRLALSGLTLLATSLAAAQQTPKTPSPSPPASSTSTSSSATPTTKSCPASPRPISPSSKKTANPSPSPSSTTPTTLAFPQAEGSKGVDQELKAALQPEMLDSSKLRLSTAVLATPTRATVAVDTTLNAADLTYTTDPAGHRHTQLLVTLVAFANTNTTDLPKPLAETTGVLNLNLDNTQFTTLLQKGLQFREQIALKPGQYTLHLGIAETTTHRIGTVSMPINLAAVVNAATN